MSRLSTFEGMQRASALRNNTPREKYDAYAGKIREVKVMILKSALFKQRSFFTNVCQSSEDSLKASFARSEMIGLRISHL